MLDAEGRVRWRCTGTRLTHLWLPRSVLQTWTNQRCQSKICWRTQKVKDYILNSFLPLGPEATLADAKDLLETKIQPTFSYPGYKRRN